MKNKILIILAAFLGTMAIYSFVLDTQDPWPVPEKYEKMKNPVDADKESLLLESRFTTNIVNPATGKKGLVMDQRLRNWIRLQAILHLMILNHKAMGLLFYKSLIGRDDMPNFEKKIPDEEDMWSVVNYMRTFE